MPTVTTDKYIWTRFKNVWANPAATTYTTPVLEKITEVTKEVITKQSDIQHDLDGFKTTVSSTYTTKTDFNNLTIGGRNLAQKTSSDYSPSYSSFTGSTNDAVRVATVLTDGLSVGDTITIRLVYKYDNIVAVEGQTAKCYIHGSGNATNWGSGSFPNSPKKNLSGSGEHIFEYSSTITANHIKNTHWSVRVRHDYIQSGSIQFKMFKVEKGNKATDWTPAPEDVDNDITVVKKSLSEVKQTADSIKTSITTIENDYTKKTEFIQTSRDFEFRIHESNSKNLMPNSSFEKKETYTRNHGFILDWTKGGTGTAYPESIDGGQYILLYTNDSDSYFVKDTAIQISPNTHYTISFYYCASQTMAGSNYLFINGNAVNIPTNYNGDRAWHRHSYTIITGGNVDGITGIRFGCVAKGESWLLIDNVQIEEGDTATAYRPKQGEICIGNAFIDREGIGVAHEDGSYSKMTVSGFRRHIGSTNHDYHYLTYTGKIQKNDMSAVTIQLPDEFKYKNFSINLSIEEIANEAGWMVQSFQVLVGAIDYNNATFEITGGSQTQFHDGTSGQTRPTTVSYIVIA